MQMLLIYRPFWSVV